MKKPPKSKRLLLIASSLMIIMSAGVAGGLACSAKQPQMASLQDEASDLSEKLGVYQNIAAYQEEIAHSLRLELNDSIGDKLVITEATYEGLPTTIAEARGQGYSLLDTVKSDGELVEAACFAHEGARHYAKLDPRMTGGVEWHGAPFLLIYNVSNEKLMGMVLESTSPQPSGPWEYHAHGHPGMDFPHWSLHLWFTDPPENLSLSQHTD